jgi:hypothetical protein
LSKKSVNTVHFLFFALLLNHANHGLAAERIDYSDMPPMSLVTTRIIVSSPHELTERLGRYGFSGLAQASNIAEKIGGKTKTLFTLAQELEQTFKQYSTENVSVKPQKVFITCVINDLTALETLEIAGYLK